MGLDYKTQVRDSDIDNLLKRVNKESYSHYLRKMEIQNLRGLSETEVRFDFPVTAIIGPNGSGKSTVLGAAGLTCQDLTPRIFFARAGKYDDSMRGWKIEYKFFSPGVKKKVGNESRMTASYRQAKWNRDAIDRPVKYVGISRTIPAAERKNLSKFIGGSFSAEFESPLNDRTKEAVQRILGKSADSYKRVGNEGSDVLAHSTGKAIYASTSDEDGVGYSEFHFGAGEASIISIVDEVENAGEQALILIEEIENGLHPVATRRLVEYLIRVAKERSVQVIFTTHSNDALSVLPNQAVWSVSGGKLYQGKLDVASLRALTGEIDTKCAIFTEDAFSSSLAQHSLRSLRVPGENGEEVKVDLSSIDIHALGGEGQVKVHTRHHNDNPTIKFPVLGFLDGDMRNVDGDDPRLIEHALAENPFEDLTFGPGDGDPEQAVFDDVVDSFTEQGVGNILGKLTLRLSFTSEDQQRVKDICNEIRYTNTDSHLLFARVAEALDFMATDAVATAFLVCWCESFPNKVRDIWKNSYGVLPLAP